ncbi:Transposase OS=Castellaniella defragrans (strain DSM / CCUG 39792 / 65Phen) OX=1437824 GN=BN940_03191 PE=4 SV=1 [Castellaniella denitrificans]
MDEATTQRIRSADSAHLETWSLNFVDAATLDDVFRD